MNKFTDKTDAVIASSATSAASVLATHAGYGVSTALVESLAGAGATLATLIDDARRAQDAAKAATLDKADGRETALAALNAIAAIVYNNGTSDSMIQAIGFSPRAAGSRPAMPLPASDVTAAAFADGTVRLGWKRSGNRPSAIFQVERSLDGGATWRIVAATSQTKTTLAGYAPGEAAWFRVTVTNSVGASLPSGAAGVYVGETAADAPVELALAA